MVGLNGSLDLSVIMSVVNVSELFLKFPPNIAAGLRLLKITEILKASFENNSSNHRGIKLSFSDLQVIHKAENFGKFN